MSLTPHLYKTRRQTFDGSSDTSGTTIRVATSENIKNLETNLLSWFDQLTKEQIKKQYWSIWYSWLLWRKNYFCV